MSSAETNGSVKAFAGAVVAVIGAVGEVLSFYAKLPSNGIVNLLVGIVLSLFLTVYAIVVIRSPATGSAKRALSIVALILGFGGLLFFVPVEIIRITTDSPSINGRVVEETSQSHYRRVPLENPQKNGTALIGTASVVFLESADLAQALISVPNPLVDQAEKLAVVPKSVTGVKINTVTKNSPTIDGFTVQPATSSLQISLKITLVLKNENSNVPKELDVFFRYWRKDKFWRLLQWIHGRYA